MGGLGTASYPDPCKTIFQRWDTWNIGWDEDQGCLEQIKLMTSANCCSCANGFIVCTEVLTRRHFEQVEVQTCAYCACAVHMQTNFTTLCLWWLRSRFLPNPCQFDIWWLTTARRNSCQSVLVRIYRTCSIVEAWLPFMICRVCTLRPLLSGWSFLFMTYANCRAIAVIVSTT